VVRRFRGRQMGRNVEIKAWVGDMEGLRRRVEEVADEGPVVIGQEDTFFNCQGGRLKVRVFSVDRGELIFYERPDRSGPKESCYRIVPVADPGLLRQVLGAALGVVGVVRKERTLYLVGQTRVHLDRVEGLGKFVELEVVLLPGQTEAEGRRTAEELMERLHIPAAALVEGAYIDLLQERAIKFP
jgi:adenylate cyclase